MKLWKYSGIYLIATGVIHNVVGILMGWEVLRDIVQDGLVNSVNTQPDRNAIFWFLCLGFFWMIIGQFLHNYILERNKALPVRFGWYLLVFAIVVCVIMPISGLWLLVPQALIIILTGQHDELGHK